MAVLEKAQFSAEDLAENFPNAPLSEASYEIRFDPKLRIPAEVWKLQEQVGAACPNFSVENMLALGGTLMPSFTFASKDRTTIVRVSQQNLGIIMTSYPGFAEFHRKVVEWTGSFCTMYGVESIARTGLRYVNNIVLPRQAPLSEYVNPFVDLTRFSSDTKNSQFVCEIRSAISDHDLMVRTALIKEPIPSYMLDIDCYVERPAKPGDIAGLLTRFHESAKVTFLEHIRPSLKAEFRRRTK
jgi:uncharacterized protein (TIGR04255 family)